MVDPSQFEAVISCCRCGAKVGTIPGLLVAGVIAEDGTLRAQDAATEGFIMSLGQRLETHVCPPTAPPKTN